MLVGSWVMGDKRTLITRNTRCERDKILCKLRIFLFSPATRFIIPIKYEHSCNILYIWLRGYQAHLRRLPTTFEPQHTISNNDPERIEQTAIWPLPQC